MVINSRGVLYKDGRISKQIFNVVPDRQIRVLDNDDDNTATQFISWGLMLPFFDQLLPTADPVTRLNFAELRLVKRHPATRKSGAVGMLTEQ